MNRREAIFGAAALGMVAACAERGSIVTSANATRYGAVQKILVASSRSPQAAPAMFSRYPAERLGFAEFAVSVPPDREPGTVTFGTDPRRDFLTVAQGPLADQAAFLRAIDGALAGRPANQREAVVFVHGFNTNFAEGLYRQAQMSADFASPGISINYTWPSAGNVSAYAVDREAALIARDGLEELIDLLGRSRVSRILLVGHSMGALVVMEAVRQAAIRGRSQGLRKIESVVLMAPDIDLEVFRRQTLQMVGYPVPIYVFASSRDRALALSALLRGRNERLGRVTDATALSDLPVTVVDVTDVQSNADALNHLGAATSPAMIAMLRGMGSVGLQMFRDEDRPPGLFESGLGVVYGVTGAVLSPLSPDY